MRRRTRGTVGLLASLCLAFSGVIVLVGAGPVVAHADCHTVAEVYLNYGPHMTSAFAASDCDETHVKNILTAKLYRCHNNWNCQFRWHCHDLDGCYLRYDSGPRERISYEVKVCGSARLCQTITHTDRAYAGSLCWADSTLKVYNSQNELVHQKHHESGVTDCAS
jgi:hypothetical protein